MSFRLPSFRALVNLFVDKPVEYVADHIEGTDAGKATAAKVQAVVDPIATNIATTALQSLMARSLPTATTAINGAFDAASAAISGVTPTTIVGLEDKLHQAVQGSGLATTVVSALQQATTVAIATGAAQAGIAQADDLSKAQIAKLQTAVLAAIGKATVATA